jgi:pantoate--beta-alanine ligase
VEVTRTVAATLASCDEARSNGASIGFVPTMGSFHDGHVSLIRRAREERDVAVVSIFVNPLQFGPTEDLDRYPRTLDADLALCRDHGVELVFAPSANTMYPNGKPALTVHSGQLGTELEGAARPGHFDGVLTVVAKLFHIVTPDLAFFGEKDYQQLVLIRQMVQELNFDLHVVGVPTVRDPDGLALSSRNAYLTAQQRRSALAMSAALTAGARAAGAGPQAVINAANAVLAAEPGIRPDYLELRAVDLGPAPERGPARLLIAARVGDTRLIDNTAVVLRPAVDASRPPATTHREAG